MSFEDYAGDRQAQEEESEDDAPDPILYYSHSFADALSGTRAGRCNEIRISPLLVTLASENSIQVSRGSDSASQSLVLYQDENCETSLSESNPHSRASGAAYYQIFYVAPAVGTYSIQVSSPTDSLANYTASFSLDAAPKLLKAKTELFGDTEAVVNQVQRKIEFSNVQAGRNFSFTIFEHNALISDLECTSEQRTSTSLAVSRGTVQVSLHAGLSVNPRNQSDTQIVTLKCESEVVEPMDVIVTYKNSDLEILSVPNVNQFAEGLIETSLGKGAFFSNQVAGKIVYNAPRKSIVGLYSVFVYDIASDKTELISTNASGENANGACIDGQLSQNSMYLVMNCYFTTNLVAGLNSNAIHIFRKNLANGNVELVSSNADGVEANANSYNPNISEDGRYISFYSFQSSNLISGVAGAQLYRKDMTTGAIVLVSSSATGEVGNSASRMHAISSDGRYVVFHSLATNLISGVGSGHIYRKDLNSGQLILVTSNSSGVAANGAGQTGPHISSNARYVVFSGTATNLVAGVTSGVHHFRKDLNTGAVMVADTSSNGTVSNSTGSSGYGAISSDGKKIGFYSAASNLISGVNGSHFYIKDLTTGAISLATSDSSGNPAPCSSSYTPVGSFSSDSSYIVWSCHNTNFFGVNDYYGLEIFKKDLLTGAVAHISKGRTLQSARGTNVYGDLSDNGEYFVFSSSALNIISGVSGTQIYRRNNRSGLVELVSTSSAGVAGNGISARVSISSDGRYVSFDSTSSNFVANVSGKQVYRKDMNSGEIVLVSAAVDGSAGSGGTGSSDSKISGDGRYVSFLGTANNLINGVSGQQIYRKDLNQGRLGAIVLASAAQGGTPSNNLPQWFWMTSDGRYISFSDESATLISGVTGRQIYRKDLSDGSLDLVSSTSTGTQGNFESTSSYLTSDGNFVIFNSSSNNLVNGVSGTQAYRKDILTGEIVHVSKSSNGTPSDGSTLGWSAITDDGRYVFMQSDATNLVAGVSGFQIYRKDLSTEAIQVVSKHDFSSTVSNGISDDPMITPDGKYLSFYGTASNLSPGVTTETQYYLKIFE